MSIIATIDAETDPFKLGRTEIRPFCFGFYTPETYREFWNIQDGENEIHCCVDLLFDFLDTLDEPHIIYAHNGGKFDFHFFLDRIDEYTEAKIINGRIVSVKIGKHEFRDSFALLPVPLAAYQKDDIDYGLMEPALRFDYKDEISKYLHADCKYLYELVAGFIERYGMSLTMAGAAMKMWEKINRAQDDDFRAPKTSAWFYESFRKFYYGGRVQCFKTGIIEGTFDYVDINSAYPEAMLQMHPISPDYDEHGMVAGKRLERLLARPYMGNLFFDIDARSRGALPYRSEIDGSLHFPDDNKTRRYFVTGWEIKAGLETGTLEIIKAHNVIEFDISGCMDFQNYIIPFYKERLQAKADGDAALDLWTKLFMNSLYGKFGANPDEYAHYKFVPRHMKNALIAGPLTPDEINEYVERDLDGWRFSGDLGGHIVAEKELENHEKRFFNVATAASITGCVRAKLWRAICESTGPIYCDTDSIAAKSFGPLSYGNELGQWGKVEASKEHGERPYVFAAVAGRKMYAFRDDKGQWKKASKGVRLTTDEIIAVAKGQTVTYTPLAPSFSVHREPTVIKRNVRLTRRVLLD